MSAVSPHVARCALLFGIPIDQEEFLARCEASPPSDYLLPILGKNNPECVWKQHYHYVASAASDLVSTALRLGAGVFRQATLADLAEASVAYDRLILVAHWRGAAVSEIDLLADSDKIVQAIADQPASVREAFGELPLTRRDLVESMNRLIETCALSTLLPKSLAVLTRESRSLGMSLCRDLVDNLLAGMIAPGNRVELFDELHSLGAMEGAIAGDYAGEIDLATCRSEAFATYIDLRRANRIRHVHWADSILPIPQFILITQALERLAIVGGSYIDARLAVEEALMGHRTERGEEIL